MITALHTLVYSDNPAATRAFFKDVLRLPFVNGGEGEGDSPNEWLIFRTGPSELGVHPTMGESQVAGELPHEIALMCDDLAATMSELSARGATFAGEPEHRGFGECVDVIAPGAANILLYQPHHAVAYDL